MRLILLCAFFCSLPCAAETVVACTPDGTLYVYVVGSDKVTMKKDGCQGGPWRITASRAALSPARLNLSADPPASGPIAVRSLQSLPPTGMVTAQIGSPGFEAAKAAGIQASKAAGVSKSSPIILGESDLPPHVFTRLIGGESVMGPLILATVVANCSYAIGSLKNVRVQLNPLTFSYYMNGNVPGLEYNFYPMINGQRGNPLSVLKTAPSGDSNLAFNLKPGAYELVIKSIGALNTSPTYGFPVASCEQTPMKQLPRENQPVLSK